MDKNVVLQYKRINLSQNHYHCTQLLLLVTMTLATIHGAGVAVATAILSCDLSIDVVDKDDCHDDEDDIYDNFLHSCLNPESVIRPLRGSVVKQI